MSNKLFPPIIEGTLPSFYLEEGNESILRIPFNMNRGVSEVSIKSFKLQVKSISTNTILGFLQSKEWKIDQFGYQAVFSVSANSGIFKTGQFYKLQLAYVDKNEVVGYYSTVGIIKCAEKPTIGIKDLSANMNVHIYNYVGEYTPSEKDPTEKMYSSYFTVYNKDKEKILQTPVKIHNINSDVEETEIETFKYNKDLPAHEIYFIQFSVTTVNKMAINSPLYQIRQMNEIPPELQADLIATLNTEDAYIELTMRGKNYDYNGYEEPQKGSFIISRATSEDNFETWNEINRFKFYNDRASDFVWRDFTIEHGIEYKYSIQQYNEKITSSRIISNSIYATFEDMFLFDGSRQLKVRFNPKMTSFKKNRLEQKIDTIGSKFPFFFRNGTVGYKEFPLSGLISYWMDDNNLFIKDEEIGINNEVAKRKRKYTFEDIDYHQLEEDTISYSEKAKIRSIGKEKQEIENLISNARTYNLVDYNITAERKFKLDVMDWLENGEYKVFKSPTEGNYIVRLMNVSLAPEEKLGRMLHNFSATAYEAMEYNFENLMSLHFIESNYTFEPHRIREKLPLKTTSIPDENGNIKHVLSFGDKNVKYLNLIDMKPGSYMTLAYKTGSGDSKTIYFGATGGYELEIEDYLESISFSEPIFEEEHRFITIEHENTADTSFNRILSISPVAIPIRQYKCVSEANPNCKNEIESKDNILNVIVKSEDELVGYNLDELVLMRFSICDPAEEQQIPPYDQKNKIYFETQYHNENKYKVTIQYEKDGEETEIYLDLAREYILDSFDVIPYSIKVTEGVAVEVSCYLTETVYGVEQKEDEENE